MGATIGGSARPCRRGPPGREPRTPQCVVSCWPVFIHANVRVNFGLLRWVIAAPQYRHWHHAREPQAYNSNYAGEFPALDALFGTLYLPADRWLAQYGVDDSEPEGYLRQLAWPLRAGCAADAAHS